MAIIITDDAIALSPTTAIPTGNTGDFTALLQAKLAELGYTPNNGSGNTSTYNSNYNSAY